MNKQTIDLSVYHEKGTILMSGRPKGVAVRAEINLDKLDSQNDEVEIIVPDEVVSLNSSFFSGLFGPSIKKLGKDAFKSKYKFCCLPQIRDDIEAGIAEALNQSNPLSKPCS
jgi:hypothetical protein